MSNPFASLAAAVADAYRVEIIDPLSETDDPIKDSAGNVSYIEVLSVDSPEGLAFDREQRAVLRRRAMTSRTGKVEQNDPVDENVEKLARLTKSWYLVDPVSKTKIEVECNFENAKQLYSAAGTAWLFRQVWVSAVNPANFMTRS